MRVEVRFRGHRASESLREQVRRRIHFQLSRFGLEISAVVVRIADLAGPKGGVDKHCRVTVRGPRLPTITIEQRDSDAGTAVDGALQRAGRTVGRRLERARAAEQGTSTSPQAS